MRAIPQQQTEPRITVKAVKSLESMSEETLCFEASLYLDGKLIGGVGNEGQGGPNRYDIGDHTDRELFKQVVAQIAEQRDETHCEFEDILVGEAVQQFEDDKIARGMLRKGAKVVLVIDKGPFTYDGIEETFYAETFIVGRASGDPEAIAKEEGADRWRVLADIQTNPKENTMSTSNAAPKKPAAKATPKKPEPTAPQEGTVDALLASVTGITKAQASAALGEASVGLADPATPEQTERATHAPDGLRGKARALYIITGNGSREQVAAGREQRGETEKKERTAKGPREGSAMHAAVTILQGASEPMTPQEIYEAAAKRGLVKGLKGKTPVATLAAQLAVQNKKGLLVERPQPGRYTLRSAA